MPKKLCTRCLNNWTDTGKPRCHECQKQWDKERNADKRQRYDAAYRKMRDMWAVYVNTDVVNCSRCGKQITDSQWDLDHLPTGEIYPSHRACNLKARHTDNNNKQGK